MGLAVAAAAALAVAVHVPSLSNGIVRDDRDLIVENPAMRGEWSLLRLATSDFWASRGGASGWWRPIPILSFAVQARAGTDPPAFHAANVGLHAAATAAFGALLAVHGLPVAAVLAAAGWFAVMPVHAESVAWIAGRTDLLCALFGFVALARDRVARARGRRLPGPWPLVAFGLALLSKEAAAPLPLVIALAAWVDRPQLGVRDAILWTAPYLLVAAAWGVAHRLIALPVESIAPYLDPTRRPDWGWVALTMLPAALRGLLPGAPIAPDHLPPIPRGPLDPLALGGLAFALAAACAAVVLARRRSPLLTPAALAAAPLLPSVAVAVAGVALALGPRAAYLPSAGVAWLFALGFSRAREAGGRTRALANALAAGLVVAGVFESPPLQRAWRDDEALYRRMTEVQPSNPAGWVGLADARAQRGARAEAESLLARAAAIAPELPALALVRAGLHYRHAEWDACGAEAAAALARDPRLGAARWLRGTAALRRRRLAEARADADTLLAAAPDDRRALALLGQVKLLSGDAAGARAALERAATGGTVEPATWFALARARAQLGDPAGAARALERVLEADPQYYEGWLQLAAAHAEAGHAAAARAAVDRALALPDAVDGRAEAMAAALVGPRRLPERGASRTVGP
jgi:tetratricopeptide (TPR) repeat protein